MTDFNRDQAEFHGDVDWLNRFHYLFSNLIMVKENRDVFTWYNLLISLHYELISVMTKDELIKAKEYRLSLKNLVNKQIELQNRRGLIQIPDDLFNTLLDYEEFLRIVFKGTGLQYKTAEDYLKPTNF
jgi:hypothetical protein